MPTQPASSADPTTAARPARGRRTQQERREATRELLLDATVKTLVAEGYRGTTTLEVERRAGVSRGARIHHFPTKASLLAGAVDHLFDSLGSHFDEAFGDAGGTLDAATRIRTGVHFLWSIYRQPAYSAVLELNLAARTDEELRERLQPVAERHRELAVDMARHYFRLRKEVAARLVDAIHAVMVGLLMERNVEDDEARQSSVLSMIEDMAIGYLPDTAGA